MALDMQFNRREDRLEVLVAGDLDINSSPQLKVRVLDEYEKKPEDIYFDFSKVDYLDSTGLGALISIYKNLKDRGHRITVAHSQEQVKKLFYITQLDQAFCLED